jgi:hypothetical protein
MRPVAILQKGQTVAEFAIFGSILLIVFGVLLSFVQRLCDQQYVEMETFRRALNQACSNAGSVGASVQYTLLEDRHHADLSGNFFKGSPTTLSSSANVFWAVPNVEATKSPSLITFRINDDEITKDYTEYVPDTHDGVDDKGEKNGEVEWYFQTEDMSTSSDSVFQETSQKKEDPASISNIRKSSLSESRSIRIPYTVRIKQGLITRDTDQVVSQGQFLDKYPGVDESGTLTQYLYRDDADGQYKYSSTANSLGNVERERTWETPAFQK